MKHSTRRSFSVIISILLIFSGLPLLAFASTNEAIVQDEEVQASVDQDVSSAPEAGDPEEVAQPDEGAVDQDEGEAGDGGDGQQAGSEDLSVGEGEESGDVSDEAALPEEDGPEEALLDENDTELDEGASDGSMTSDETQALEDASAVPLATPYEPRDIKNDPDLLNGASIITSGTIEFSKDGQIFTPDPDTGRVTIPADAEGKFNFSFEIPSSVVDKIREGDYYDVELPEEFVIGSPIWNQQLTSDNGVEYATLSVFDDNGTPKARLTFTDKAAGAGTLTGDFYFSADVDSSSTNPGGHDNIGFPTEEQLPEIPISVKPLGGQAIEKSGIFDQEVNPNSIIWTVDVNKTLDDLTYPVTIEDLLPDSLPVGLVTNGSITIQELPVAVDGTVGTPGADVGFSVDRSDNKLILILDDPLPNQAVRITFETPISDAAKPQNGGKMTFTNAAEVTAGNQSDPSSTTSSVTAEFKKALVKTSAGYEMQGQRAHWQVVYNTLSLIHI